MVRGLSRIGTAGTLLPVAAGWATDWAACGRVSIVGEYPVRPRLSKWVSSSTVAQSAAWAFAV